MLTIQQQLIDIFQNYSGAKLRQLLYSHENAQLRNFLDNNVPVYFQNDRYTQATKDYCAVYHIETPPTCKVCGKPIETCNVKNRKIGFTAKFCSAKCRASDKDIQKQIEETMLRKYGVTNSMYSEELRNKLKRNNLKKYGTENVFGSEIIKNKIKQTCLERYGTENPLQCEKIKQKSRQTLLDKYGVISPLQTKEGMQHFRKVMNEKYGCDYARQNHDIRQKMEQTLIRKYGEAIPMKNRDIFLRSTKRYLYNNIYFHSSYELAYYIWLTDNNITFEYQPDISYQYSYDNKIHNYFPDFLVEGKPIEIKGSHFFDKHGNMINPYNKLENNKLQKKYQCMLDNNVVILTNTECKEFLQYVKKKYGKYYIKSFGIKPSNK